VKLNLIVFVRFCGLKGHEMFCEVERSYIEDGFNLYGLRACVSNFSDCLDLILDRIGPDDSDDSHLTQSACTLYGLIHARYIITAHGLDAMYNKVSASLGKWTPQILFRDVRLSHFNPCLAT
jgi:casein kinase II subunit beta